MARAAAQGQDLDSADVRVQSADLLQVFIGPLGTAVVRIFANHSPVEAKRLMDRLIAYAEGLAEKPSADPARLVNVVGEPIQREGYVEQTHVSYEDRRQSKGEKDRGGKSGKNRPAS